MLGRPAGERPLLDGDAVLAGPVLLEAGFEPHVQRRVLGHRFALGNAIDVLSLGRHPVADEAGPAVDRLEDVAHVGLHLDAVDLRFLAQQRLLGREDGFGVVAREVDDRVLGVQVRVVGRHQSLGLREVDRVG